MTQTQEQTQEDGSRPLKKYTFYGYDAASRLISQAYPNGWNETLSYDAAGQLLTHVKTDPTNSPSKTITRTYTYDMQGNMWNSSRRERRE